MLRLPQTLAAWNTAAFDSTLKRELETAGAAVLPLQQCLATSSYILDGDCEVMVLGKASRDGGLILETAVTAAKALRHARCAGCSGRTVASPDG